MSHKKRDGHPILRGAEYGSYHVDYGWKERAKLMFGDEYFQNLTVANLRYMYLNPSYTNDSVGYVCNWCGRASRFLKMDWNKQPECKGCRQIINEKLDIGMNDGFFYIQCARSENCPSSPYTPSQLGYTVQRDVILTCNRCMSQSRMSLPSFLKNGYRCRCGNGYSVISNVKYYPINPFKYNYFNGEI